jgi:hypothetical protein
MPQGLSYTPFEEFELMKGYVHASENLIKGAELSFAQFQSDVYSALVPALSANPSIEVRPAQAYFRRAKTISREVGRFSSFNFQVISLRTSGHTSEDELQATCKMYAEYCHEEKQKVARSGARGRNEPPPPNVPFTGTPPFTFHWHQCWDMMKHHPKWAVRAKRSSDPELLDYAKNVATGTRKKSRDAAKRDLKTDALLESNKENMKQSNELKKQAVKTMELGYEVALAAAGLLDKEYSDAIIQELRNKRFKASQAGIPPPSTPSSSMTRASQEDSYLSTSSKSSPQLADNELSATRVIDLQSEHSEDDSAVVRAPTTDSRVPSSDQKYLVLESTHRPCHAY